MSQFEHWKSLASAVLIMSLIFIPTGWVTGFVVETNSDLNSLQHTVLQQNNMTYSAALFVSNHPLECSLTIGVTALFPSQHSGGASSPSTSYPIKLISNGVKPIVTSAKWLCYDYRSVAEGVKEKHLAALEIQTFMHAGVNMAAKAVGGTAGIMFLFGLLTMPKSQKKEFKGIKRVRRRIWKRDDLLWIGSTKQPEETETQHLLIYGTTGAGKTQIARLKCALAVKRGEAGLIIDRNGDLITRFWRPGDKVICPLDARSEKSSALAELAAGGMVYHADHLAALIIPDPPQGASGEVQHFAAGAREGVSAALLSARSNADFLLIINRNALLRQALIDAGAGAYGESTDREFSAYRTTVFRRIRSFKYYHGAVGRDGFAILNWIYGIDERRQRTGDAGRLWLNLSADTYSAITEIVPIDVAIFVDAVQRLPEDTKRRIHVVFEEIAQYTAISALAKAVTEGRKYGLSLATTTQSLAGIRAVYGSEQTAVLLGCLVNQVVMTAASAKDAEEASNLIGERLIKSVGSSPRAGGPLNLEQLRAAVTPHELRALPLHDAYVWVAGAQEWVRTTIPKFDPPKDKAPGFLKRDDLSLEPVADRSSNPLASDSAVSQVDILKLE